MSKTSNVLVAVAAVAVIIAVGIYVGTHVHSGCFFGTCAAIITK